MGITLAMGMHVGKYYCSAEVPPNTQTLPSNHQRGLLCAEVPSPHPQLLFGAQLHVPPDLFSPRWLAGALGNTVLPAVTVVTRCLQPLDGKSGSTPQVPKLALFYRWGSGAAG